MLKRFHSFTTIAAFAVSTCFAMAPDGFTKAKAIPLKQREPAKAVGEEFTWMMTLYGYTPLLAMRDAMVDAVRKVKATKKSVHADPGWGHSTQEQNGHLISHWWFVTPRGKREVYFDNGALLTTPGEVERQESARAQYMGRMTPTLKAQVEHLTNR